MIIFWFIVALLGSVPAWAQPGGINSRAWILIDQASGRELASHQPDLPLAPASLTQLMTAYVIFGDVRRNKLSLAETVTVPRAATEVDGSRVFLKEGEKVSVETLLQAILVHSASDATLALITATDGTEAIFVSRMNEAARRLGMTKTYFMNATGLTEPGHESTARDLATLSRALVREFPERSAFFDQKELAFKGITYYNDNRLLWRDSTITGLKVGRTTQAGYVMAASAQRGTQTRIAVLLGARSDAQRAQEALKLLNYGFENFESARLYRARQPVKVATLYRGARSSLNIGFEQDFYLLAPRGGLNRVKAVVITREPIVAPIRRGQRMGTLRLTLDGETLGTYPLVALHDVSVAGLLGRGWDSIRLFFSK